MIINIQYDTSVTILPQALQNQIHAAVDAAVSYYEHVFTNPITFTINVGWGECNGSAIPAGDVSFSQATTGTLLPYAQVYTSYQNNRNTADNITASLTLATTDPTSGGNFVLTPPEMEALGLSNNNPTNTLFIGLNSSDTWTFDPSNRGVAGANDAIGAIEHGISEMMGRHGSLGQAFGTNVYTPLDLFRYASAGNRQLTYGNGFFSIDGQNMLRQYNNPTDGDTADWLGVPKGGTNGDSFGDSNGGFICSVDLTDLREMNIIGWKRALTTVDDFNGDGVSDILLWSPTTGGFGSYNMQGSPDGFQGGPPGNSNPAYTAIGVGDFLGGINSQRVDDVLFRNSSTGDTWYYHWHADRIAQGWHQIGGSDTHYAVVGVGDFFGDQTSTSTGATSDILFRNNSTGDTWIEAMNVGIPAGWHPLGGSDTHYAVVGVGDFYGADGDGTSDILYRNNSTGDLWFEAISNGAFNGWHSLGGSDTHYAVVGIGDFYGNGTDDILFRNNSTGDMWFEAISNGAFNGWHPLGGSDTHYAVVATGDYYGNGTSDILFRNNATADTWYEAISSGAPAVSIFTNSPWHHVVLNYQSPDFKVVA